MTADLTGDAEGQTPLDEDELRGLRLTYVTTRGELNAAEQANIVAGRTWATARTRTIDQILDDVFSPAPAPRDVSAGLDMGWEVPQAQPEHRH